MTQLRRSSKDLTATRTATTTDAEFRLQEDDKTEEVFLEFLRALPAEGQRILARDIAGRDDRRLEELGSDVKAFMFSYGKARGDRAPSPSELPSASSVGQRPESSEGAVLKAVGKLYEQLDSKEACLMRDSNRCLVIGFYDTIMSKELPESELEEVEDDTTNART